MGNVHASGAIKHTKITVKHTKITDESATDFFEQLFTGQHITPEHWQLISAIRRLAVNGRRSQGVGVRLQSHSQYWGMPHMRARDTYVNASAERRWKLFLLYLRPFVEHQLVDRKMTELLMHGGHVMCAGGHATAVGLTKTKRPVSERASDLARAGFTIGAVQNTLRIIEYVFEKTVRRRQS
ncbi:MAG: hypothetical protein V4482_06815 [Pseudomonadota bacterium]